VPLAAFICLQILDAITTFVFLQYGIREGNPLIRLSLAGTAHPLLGLALPKLFAVLLGVYAWRRGRRVLLWRMNALFAACVAWNTLVVIAAA
jgi:hypothetical protein